MTTLSTLSYFAHFASASRSLRGYVAPLARTVSGALVCTACGTSSPLPPPTYAAAPPNVETSSVAAPDDDAPSHDGHASATDPSGSTANARVHGVADTTSDEEHGIDDESDELDASELGPDQVALTPRPPHPLAHRTASQLQAAVREEPQTLGPMSVGAPNGGALFNAVQLPEDPRWERVDASHAWGTQETVDSLIRAVGKVHEAFPDSPRLPIGHLSARYGGHLNPHRSHQAGTDVDVGYYYKPEAHRWYVRGTRETLDLPRTWALVRAFITETDVRFILIDQSIQALLREYATSIGEDEQWLSDVFKGRGYSRPPLIRHAKGHATHLHVRFYSPIAEETGRRCYGALLSAGKIKPSTTFVSYKAKKGDTLLSLAKRFGTTVKAIKRVNGLRSNTILAKRSYKIPSTGHSVHQARPVDVPPRRLPPVNKVAARTNPVKSVTGATLEAPAEDIDGCSADNAGGECE